mmetsp:Transcript_27389/g.40141  ORF Transcript_27389/g.40141 Transcript_27389/m.40141 type:complete len:408 (-) Transcript_27389:234-1457(-)
MKMARQMRREREASSMTTHHRQSLTVTPVLLVCILLATTTTKSRCGGGVDAFVHPQTATWTTSEASTTATRLDVSAVLEPPPTVGFPDDGSNRGGFGVSSYEWMSSSGSPTVDLPWMDYVDHHGHGASSSSSLPPVIFLHGLLGNKRNFQTLAASLGATLTRERRLIGMDLRNHGDNLDMMDSMSYADMARDVLSTLDRHILHSQNKNQKVILVGHSMGAKVAQALALLMPDRVEGMVLLDMAPVTYDPDEPSWKTVSDILHLLKDVVPSSESPSSSSITKRQVDQWLQPSLPDPALRAFCLTNWDAAKSDWKMDLHKVCSELDTLRQFELVSSSENSSQQEAHLQYDGDVLLIHGGKSKFVKSSHLPTIQSYFPNHMLTTIRGAGHWVHAEAPDDVMLLLKRYLDR